MRYVTRRRVFGGCGASAVLAVAGIAVWADPVRNAPPLRLRWSSTAGGGASLSGGEFTADVSVGQSVTGATGGGAFAAGAGSWSVNAPVRCGDLDGDGDVDLIDHAAFMACLATECDVQPPSDCDGTEEVDLSDYAHATAAMTGPR